jgi:RNA polymerase sigma factor (sigma-70 family)
MSEHIETKRKLKAIYDVKTFNELLDKVMMCKDERTLMELYYIENKDFNYIADVLGYSESTMKRWHKKILKRINKLF